MRGRMLVNISYFLLIFVNVVPVAITKHGTQHSAQSSHKGKNNGLNNHEHYEQHKQHESGESAETEEMQIYNRNHHNSAHYNSGHNNPTQQNNQNINKLECKCDNILTCECDSTIAEPSAIGNFSCSCADKKGLYLKGDPIDCNCLKAHLSSKHLECQCIQKNGSTLSKTIDCPEASGYLIETNERLIDFSGINHTVHIFDKSNQNGQMKITEHVLNQTLATTIPTIPKFPDDVNPLPTTTSEKPVVTITTNRDLDIDFITTTPIPKVPSAPNDNEYSTEPLITTTPEGPRPVIENTVSPTKIPELPTEVPNIPSETPEPPIDMPEITEGPTETLEPFERTTEAPELPTEEPEHPFLELEPFTEEPKPSTEEPKPTIKTPPPPTEKPAIPTEYPPSNTSTPQNPLSPPEAPPPKFPEQPVNEYPKEPDVNWAIVKDDYYFWTMIIEITRTEFRYIYEDFVEHFEDEVFDLCNGTYVDGHVTCNSNEITDQCTKENLCNCMCVGAKTGEKVEETCFCNPHVLQPVVKYPAEVDLKECRCYNPDNNGNSLICDCNKAHSVDTIEPLVLTELHIIDISIIIRYLTLFNFEGDINICGCAFYNGESNCQCKDDTEYYTEESTADCLCFYKFENGNLIGHCYCADGIKDKEIEVKYDKDLFVVQTCNCYNQMNEGTSLKCLCEDYAKPKDMTTYGTVQIDLSQLQDINTNIMLSYFLQVHEFRNEHFEVCACKISNGEASCSCLEPMLHCTEHTPCSCLSVYQYQHGNWIRMLFCNPHILESKFKFDEQTTELDNCTCHHSEPHKLISKCTTIFSIDSAKQFDFNNVILDLTKNQVINTNTLLNGFSQIREYHNETFKLLGCAYGSNGFMCIGQNIALCKPENPCKCLCIAYVENKKLGAKCVCNPHVEETKIDYNPAVFDLEIFTCLTPMKFFLNCNYRRKEAINYEFTTKSIIETYLIETNQDQNLTNTYNSGGTYQAQGQGGGQGEQGNYWQSGPEGSTTSEVRIINYTMPAGQGGRVITSKQEVIVDGGESIPQGQGSTTSQTKTMKFNSVEEMQKFLKSQGGSGSYTVKQHVQEIPAIDVR